MGIPGLLKEIGKGERIALSKLAIDHLEKARRPLRVAIDVAIWNFQHQAGKGGKNPELRTLYYRLLRLLALPIHPVFVYDGKDKPRTKRGKTVSSYGNASLPSQQSKKLINLFRFPCHNAPGEAEAECAFLQKNGIVDAVMSQDADAIMFGSTLTLRDWSHEGTKGNKAPTHVYALEQSKIQSRTGLDPDGMVLVALLSGGDYDEGVPGFGPGIACEIAKAGFGKDLLQIIKRGDENGLAEWRERLQLELEENFSEFFKTKHKALKIPQSFPDRTVLKYYTDPTTSAPTRFPEITQEWTSMWKSSIDISELRQYVANTFDWQYKPGAWKLVRTLAPSLLASMFWQQKTTSSLIKSTEQITERRKHFTNDGIPELRIGIVPADVAGLDLEAEEDSPEYLASLNMEQDNEEEPAGDTALDTDGQGDNILTQRSPSKIRKSPPWNPYLLEKQWFPETVVKLGIPALVEEWEQIQRDLQADPKKFASRKCVKAGAPTTKPKTKIQSNKLHSFLQPTKLPESTSERHDTGEKIDLPGPNKKFLAASMSRPMLKDDSLASHFKTTKSSSSTMSSSKRPARQSSPGHSQSNQASRSPKQPKTGESISSFIEITSSSPTIPSPRQRTEGTACTVSIVAETPQNLPSSNVGGTIPLSPSVTLRKKPQSAGIGRRKNTVQAAQTKNSAPKPIESFFGKNLRRDRAVVHDNTAAPNVSRVQSGGLPSISASATTKEARRDVLKEVPSEPGTGLRTKLDLHRKAALPRESLQGSWKEVIDETLIVNDVTGRTPRRVPRISHIDLTAD